MKETDLVRISIIGGGNIARIYAKNFAKMPVQVVGVYDIRPHAACHTAQLCGATSYSSCDEMLATVNPDIVCICLPTYLHKQFVLQCAVKGLDIICETPLALNISDAKEMIRICDQNGVKLFISHTLRFYPEYEAMRLNLSSGVIGEVGVVHAKRWRPFPKGWNNWYADPTKSGGIIVDSMIQDIDYMRWVLGEVTSVYGMRSGVDHHGGEYATVTLRFKNGAIVNLEALWGYPGKCLNVVEFAGKKGIIRSDSNRSKSFNLVKSGSCQLDGPVSTISSRPSLHDPIYHQLWHFIDSSQKNNQPTVNNEDAYKALQIALAAKKSSISGNPIYLGRGVE